MTSVGKRFGLGLLMIAAASVGASAGTQALQRLSAGDVDQALAMTMRLPGAGNATGWVTKARRYVAAHRALDEIESAALLGGNV